MRSSKKLLSLLLALCMVFSLTCTAFAAEGTADTSMAGKTVILHSNDVHGAVAGYAKIAALKAEYEAKGADVILADAGDYSQGTVYVSTTKGANAVALMNAAGYDVATIGNHEFDYGYENLNTIMKDAKFQVLCADVTKDGEAIFDANTIIEKGGVKIGFFGLETPEAQTKANPALIQGLEFVAGKDLYACAQAQVDALKEQGADIIICLAHLGVDKESAPNRSVDMYDNVTGIDFVIDGHSHSVMAAGVEKIQTGEKDGAPVYAENPFASKPIQSTGTAFANVGVIVIDDATKKIESNELVPMENYEGSDKTVADAAKAIVKEIDAEYGEVFAKSDVDLNGNRDPGNRTEETNLGNLITDAMVWSVLKDEGSIKVPAENVVAITNGGGIRAAIAKGDITKKDVNTVLPFGNTVAVVYVTGAELLEALEASTYCTPTAVGGFPQVSGLKFTLNIGMLYDANDETYPASTYYGPKTIQRVTIDSINGQPFDAKATYAVITNNFCAAGGDTYYAFASATEQFDTGIPLDEALMAYITEELDGVVGEAYEAPEGRITVVGKDMYEARGEFEDILSVLLPEECYTVLSAEPVNKAIALAEDAKNAGEMETAVAALKEAVPNLVFASNTFTDVPTGKWFTRAVDFVQVTGLMAGMTPTTFGPNVTMTRAMVAAVLYREAGAPSVEGLSCPFTDLKADEYYVDAVIWAYNNGVFAGKTETTFAPNDTITREQMAAVLLRLSGVDISDTENDEAQAEILDALREIYKDADAVSEYARIAVLSWNIAGVMVGDTDGTFRPASGLTRAEFATIMVCLYDLGIEMVLGTADDVATTAAAFAA